MTKNDERIINWPAIEIDYRAGVKSLRVLAAEYGISHGAINKRARRDGWPRDLSARIAERTRELVSRAAVSAEDTAVSRAAEKAVVEANATLQADIILAHRTDIQAARALVVSMLKELDLVSQNRDQLEQMAEAVTADDKSGRRQELFERAISLPSRAGAVDKLSGALSRLVALEREAFGLNRGEVAPDPVDEMSREQLEAAFVAMMDRARIINGEVVNVP